MAIKIEYRFGATVQGGPSVNVKQGPVEVDAYDVVSATLAPNDKKTLNVQPAGTAGAVLLFVITADVYDKDITYDVSGTKVPLDGPLLLAGPGAVGLLGATPPEEATFENGTNNPVQVQVLVGREA